MGFLSWLFGTSKERQHRTCISIYHKAKKRRPNKTEHDYLKIVLLTKPPFDYQHDEVINEILSLCKDIHELASYIVKNGTHLWDSRERNLKFSNLQARNQQFFKEFWNDNLKVKSTEGS